MQSANKFRTGLVQMSCSTDSKENLSKAEYKIEEDNYPPTNRTMENFFKGAWMYHVHNQVGSHTHYTDG